MAVNGSTLNDQGENLVRIEQYLVEETLRRVRKVEECEHQIDVAEKVLRKVVDYELSRGIIRLRGNTTKDDLYRDRYKKDTDWHNLSGTLKWHLALADMYSSAAAAVRGLLNRQPQDELRA